MSRRKHIIHLFLRQVGNFRLTLLRHLNSLKRMHQELTRLKEVIVNFLNSCVSSMNGILRQPPLIEFSEPAIDDILIEGRKHIITQIRLNVCLVGRDCVGVSALLNLACVELVLKELHINLMEGFRLLGCRHRIRLGIKFVHKGSRHSQCLSFTFCFWEHFTAFFPFPSRVFILQSRLPRFSFSIN